ncbi:E3 ubiquitin-protein ligase HRD1 [Gryllus bimaculatus]|nr:E3 ubiquitin-protein ligase HRD1 [Gryllus bimaculatus]
MRAVGAILISLVLTTAVIGNAYYQKKQFYPSVVYITKSNPSMAVIYLQAFILVILMGKLMRKVFFGQLRAAEFEHLMERSWYAVTETCLAFTVFRDDFSPKFIALFTLLLFLKSFHWLAEDRVDYMERSPVISWLFHIRVLSLLLMLGFLDTHFVCHAYQSTVTKGASVQLVFGFEYAILLTIIVNILIKYALHTVDLNSENPWENKAVFLLYTELVMGFFKVLLYLAFVVIMVRIYTLPLFALRPMYYTMRAFKKAFNDVILSRRAIHNMNTLYPDATPEELAAADNVCIICREEMVTASKKLPCNHIFHTSCLRSWFQRQQTCPTCRLNILRTPTAPSHAPPPQPAAAPAAGGAAGPAPAGVAPPGLAGVNPFQPFGGPGPIWHMWQQAAAAAGQRAGDQQQQQQQQQPRQQQQQSSGSGSVPPPPMPPANFAGLSLEELQRMEGHARENVEARLQCLRNIQLLLDASVTMMHQYSMVVQSTARMPPPSSPPQASTSANNTSSEPVPKPSVTPAETRHKFEKGDNLEGAAGPSINTTTTPTTTTTETGNSEASPVNDETREQQEIRRRRLQKFAQTSQTTE